MAIETQVTQLLTQPQYLILLEFRSLTLRYSTRGTVTWNGQSWLGGAGARVDRIQKTSQGNMTATLTLPNQSLALSAILLNEGVADQPVRVWKAYGDTTIAADDATQVFEGVIDSAPTIADTVVLNLVSENVFNQFSPRVRAGPPLMNHIPPAGTIIEWGSDIYELERR